MSVEENLRLMKTLDDAWNAGPESPEWETFRKRHTDNVAVYWPGQPDPTRGIHNHDSEAVEFFKIFPDNHLVNNPYKILFGQSDYTCSVADFTGTMKGPMKGADGKMIPPTNKKFQIESWRPYPSPGIPFFLTSFVYSKPSGPSMYAPFLSVIHTSIYKSRGQV